MGCHCERYCFKLRYPGGLNTNNYKPEAQISPAIAPGQRQPREGVVENKKDRSLLKRYRQQEDPLKQQCKRNSNPSLSN